MKIIYKMDKIDEQNLNLTFGKWNEDEKNFDGYWNTDKTKYYPTELFEILNGISTITTTKTFNFTLYDNNVFSVYFPSGITEEKIKEIFDSLIDISIEEGLDTSEEDKFGKYKIKLESRLNVVSRLGTTYTSYGNNVFLEPIAVKKGDWITVIVEFDEENDKRIFPTNYNDEFERTNNKFTRYRYPGDASENKGYTEGLCVSGVYHYKMNYDRIFLITTDYMIYHKEGFNVSESGYLKYDDTRTIKNPTHNYSINKIVVAYGKLTQWDLYLNSDRDTDIYLDEPLYEGEYIDFATKKVYKADGTIKQDNVDIPELQTYEDYGRVQVLTKNVPSKIELEYVGYKFKE